MRYRLAVAVLYVALLVWAAYSSDEALPGWIGIALIFVAPFAVGFAVGRLWAVLLPGIVVLLSVPAGYGAGETEFPVWFAMIFVGVIAVPAIVIGWAARRLARWYLSRSGTAHGRADGGASLYTVRPNGAGLRRLTRVRFEDVDPVWCA